MTDLQIGLLVLGVAAVVGVVAYNRVQERAVRREAERAFGSAHSDVLLGDVVVRREPALPEGEAPRERRLHDMPDERVDYVMVLRMPAGISAAAALDPWHGIEQRFGRRALLAGSEGTGWRRVLPGDYGSCTALRAALQLVSRSGVLSDAELIEFRSEVETLATRIGATVEAPEMREALEAARDLDRRCADADVQVALHVTGELDPAAVSSALAELGEVPYHVTERSDGVTLVLDVPRVADVGRSYEAMTRMAAHLAHTLGGRVVDDRGNPLDERALAAIGAELEPMRRQLSEAGVEPGSPLALRLFS
jgi:hypothetical protein